MTPVAELTAQIADAVRIQFCRCSCISSDNFTTLSPRPSTLLTYLTISARSARSSFTSSRSSSFCLFAAPSMTRHAWTTVPRVSSCDIGLARAVTHRATQITDAEGSSHQEPQRSKNALRDSSEAPTATTRATSMITRGAGVPDWQREERVTIDSDAFRALGRECSYCLPWDVSVYTPPATSPLLRRMTDSCVPRICRPRSSSFRSTHCARSV